jgi:hypothetical protein
MDKLLRIFTALDWLVGSVCLVTGVWTQNWWLAAGGLLGLVAAWYKPALRIKAVLDKKFVKKKTSSAETEAVLTEDLFYAEALKAAGPSEKADFTRVLPTGPAYLTKSKHNILTIQVLGTPLKRDPQSWA